MEMGIQNQKMTMAVCRELIVHGFVNMEPETSDTVLNANILLQQYF